MRKVELARQLHDTVASDLTAVIVKLEGMAIKVPECADDLRVCVQSARQAMFGTRQLLQNLTAQRELGQVKKAKLDNILLATIARLAGQGFNVKGRFETSGLELPESTVEVLSQSLQEAVTNILKYADLNSEVELHVCVESRRLVVSVTNAPAVGARCDYSEGRGLENMATTLARVSGYLQIRQSPGCWMVMLSVPLF
ncbi:histidine kinase [Staphylococcus chromogenes]|nr:histidine kinase [Staphylococcus chromogenes]